MLAGGLQHFHGGRLLVAQRQGDRRPDPGLLEVRYQQLKAAS
jgi:hypothetical protein